MATVHINELKPMFVSAEALRFCGFMSSYLESSASRPTPSERGLQLHVTLSIVHSAHGSALGHSQPSRYSGVRQVNGNARQPGENTVALRDGGPIQMSIRLSLTLICAAGGTALSTRPALGILRLLILPVRSGRNYSSTLKKSRMTS